VGDRKQAVERLDRITTLPVTKPKLNACLLYFLTMLNSLYLEHGRARSPPPPDDRLDREDHLPLPFFPEAQCCAVIAEVRSDSIRVYTLRDADETHEPALKHLLVTKNSGKKQFQDQIPLPRKVAESTVKG